MCGGPVCPEPVHRRPNASRTRASQADGAVSTGRRGGMNVYKPPRRGRIAARADGAGAHRGRRAVVQRAGSSRGGSPSSRFAFQVRRLTLLRPRPLAGARRHNRTRALNSAAPADGLSCRPPAPEDSGSEARPSPNEEPSLHRRSARRVALACFALEHAAARQPGMVLPPRPTSFDNSSRSGTASCQPEVA